MTDLVARLTTHRTLGTVPRRELEWLVAHGELRHFEPGDLAQRKGEAVTDMVIMLSGRVALTFDHGTGRGHRLESRGGDVTALLPFSRATTAFGDARVEESADALMIHRDRFPEMLRECPTVIEILVHTMVDRARMATSANWQDEKLLSLGRLAAGFAHELNNPASAAVRSASLMQEAVRDVSAAARAVGAAALTDAQRGAVDDIRARSLVPPTTGVLSVLDRGDREDDIASWLDRHGVDPSLAVALAESGLTIGSLEQFREAVTGEGLDLALRWTAAEFTANALAIEVQRATARIHNLVNAMKRFTNMDRASTKSPIHIAQGLADTVAMLATRAREKSVAVRLEVAPDIPTVSAVADELNQVWSNLIENAIDAVSEQGTVIVCAAHEGDNAVVRVIDDGPGIPADAQSRVFDAFFTTKPVGQGMGLGLDIVRRIMVAHEGHVAVDTRPGRTEFSVSLPVSPTASV